MWFYWLPGFPILIVCKLETSKNVVMVKSFLLGCLKQKMEQFYFSDRFDILEGNYCRNPGGIVDFPFCYTHAKDGYCRVELCDVSNLGKGQGSCQ